MDLTYAKTNFMNLNNTLFPNLSPSILVHAGFANDQSQCDQFFLSTPAFS